MTIARVNAGGWAVGEMYTSSQCNAMDINATYAADRRDAQTDTVGAIWTFQNAGRIIPTFVDGANANTSYGADGGNTVIRVDSTVAADRVYTLLAANAVAGDVILIYVESTFTNEITVQNEALDILYTLGRNVRSDGEWCEFRWNGTAWFPLRRGGGRARYEEWLAGSTAWIADVPGGILLGYGGAGGGGAGYTHSSSTTNVFNGGGAGGGGSIQTATFASFVLGRQYVASVGAGGTGASSGGANGGDGTDSGFLDDFTSIYVALWTGGQGGRGGSAGASNGPSYAIPGMAVREAWRPPNIIMDTTDDVNFFSGPLPPASGGFGYSNNNITIANGNGSRNPLFWAGGGTGSLGTDSATYRGGGAGGGGGGGPGGVGGAGGNGSNGNNAGVSAAGGNGVSGAANTGGGGGGAGASGHGSAGQGGTGTAGNGGSGKVALLKVK